MAVTEMLHAARSAKLSPVIILFDLSAAFDTVNHKTLLFILMSLGIHATALQWITSYKEGQSDQMPKRESTSALQDEDASLVSHKGQYLVLFCSPSSDLLVRTYPQMYCHTTAMHMPLNSFSFSLPQNTHVSLRF